MPTESPQSTVVPGQMRSDREEIPGGFTKQEADLAETNEAKRTMSRGAPGCQDYWPSPHQVCGAIKDKYNSLGGPNSFLLWPTSPEIRNPDNVGVRQTFNNGPSYWHPNAGAHPVVNHFFAAWARHGYEGGYLRYPTTDEIPSANGGRRQEFQGAAIYWRLNQAYAIGGAIRAKWNLAGAEGGPLGYPTTDEVSVSKNSGRYNNFENGTITWSGPTGARLLFGLIRDRWSALGREDGGLGYPTGDEQVAVDGVGHFAYFEDGSAIYSFPPIGAWRVSPVLLNLWGSEGRETGDLGYPIENSRTTNLAQGIREVQRFQRGIVTFLNDNRMYIAVYKP